MKLNVRLSMWSLGIFAAVTFTLCVLYGLLVPPAFHSKQLLEMVLPGFRWVSFGMYLLGLVETFLYGAYVGVAFALIHNFLVPRLERRSESKISRIAA